MTIRIGIIGLGANTRLRHVPGLRACDGVEIVGVCNRRPESTAAAAAEFDIPGTYSRWEELVADPGIDAVVIGTWPYLHCEITCAALEAGKHVLTEARMARDAEEARRMYRVHERHADRVAQIVPSPFGLRAHAFVVEQLRRGFLGTLREVVVLGVNDAVADPEAPLHWRQSRAWSGLNMLALGILHETLIRWVPDPVRVLAQTHTFVPARNDPWTGQSAEVGTPDSVHVLSELAGGARGVYHLSGAVHFGPGMQIHLYGDAGTLKYDLLADRLWGAQQADGELREMQVPEAQAGGWRVEEEFVNAIAGREPVRFTDFATGVRYMEFTTAVARSAELGRAVQVAGVV